MYRKLFLTLLILTTTSLTAFSQLSGDKKDALQNTISADSAIVNSLKSEGVTFSNNNSVTLLTTGQAKFDDLFCAIDHAQESIHMEYFNFRNDSIANLLFDKLAVKALQGVEIRLIYDSFGNTSNNRPLKKKHIENLRKRGIQIYEFDPITFPWVNHVFSRDHRKIVVIDGEVAFTGGMNVADYYIHGTNKVGEWHDMHCRIEGEEVNTLQKIFLETWYKVSGEIIVDDKYFNGSRAAANKYHGTNADECENAGQKMVGIINREPRSSNKIIRTFYVDAINGAQENIKLVNPYFTLSHKIKKALANAAKRGVKVEIMLSTRSDIPLTPDCGYYNAHKLMKKGCDVWMYTPGFHHTKVIMIDGKVCTVGSANLNARSLRFDYEENAVIVDTCTTAQLNRIFDGQKADSFLLTPESWNEFRTPWQKFRGWFAHLLAPFL